MRIALVHPTYWPEVRRGSERFIHDLAVYLSGRGHEVTVLTSHRARPIRSKEDGFTVVRGWRPPARLQPRGMEPHANHAPLALLAAVQRRFDLVHALHIPDAWGVSWWSRFSGRPLILSLMGYPDRRSLDSFHGRRRMLTKVADRARAVHVLSDAARRALHDAAGIGATVINLPTNTSAFHVDLPRAEHPTLFCAASPADRRKRVPLLVEAFRLLRERRPDAELRIAGPLGSADPDSLRAPGVVLVGEVETRLLSVEYARAWISVLPSAREAFGMVLVESLAAGTPAVGTRDGAIPEILDDPRIGVLSEDSAPRALADALDRGLNLSRSDGIRDACRRHAERWDWRHVGPRFEAIYRAAVRGAGSGAG
jgi:phosphatidylinositol alpha-mannosyltransferase